MFKFVRSVVWVYVVFPVQRAMFERTHRKQLERDAKLKALGLPWWQVYSK